MARLRKAVGGFPYLVPALVLMVLFFFWPLIRSLYLSMHGSDMFGRPAGFIGLDNYIALFSGRSFPKVLWTTLWFAVFTVLPTILISLLLALLLNTQARGTRLLRTAFALPFAYSVAAASVIFGVMFNPVTGILNSVLGAFGAPALNWLNDPNVAFYAVCAATVWMQLGYNLLVLSAGLAAVPTELLEAAHLDGATPVQLNYHVIIPLIGPQLFFLTVTGVMHALQSFGQIHILTRGGPADTTTTLVYSIYEAAFADNNSNFGMASAQAMVLLSIVLLVTFLQFKVVEKRVFYK